MLINLFNKIVFQFSLELKGVCKVVKLMFVISMDRIFVLLLRIFNSVLDFCPDTSFPFFTNTNSLAFSILLSHFLQIGL